MEPRNPSNIVEPTKVTLEDFNTSFARIDFLLAKTKVREESLRDYINSTESIDLAAAEALSRERIGADELSFFHYEHPLDTEEAGFSELNPAFLGVGTNLSSGFAKSGSQGNTSVLRDKLLPKNGRKTRHMRGGEAKEQIRTRMVKADESSDTEEEGRSGLGRAKKRRLDKIVEAKKDSTSGKIAQIDIEHASNSLRNCPRT